MEINLFELEMTAKEKREELLRAGSGTPLLCSLPVIKNSALCGCK